MAESLDMNKVTIAGDCLHRAVQDFVFAVSNEYIDFSVEKKRESNASKAVENFEKACMEDERALSTLDDNEKAGQSRKVLSEKKERSNVDIITFQRAMLRFKQRKAQFEKCNPITRNLLSPRATRYDPWGDDTASPRSREIGEIYCILIPFIIFGLFAAGYLLSSQQIGGKASIAARLPKTLRKMQFPFMKQDVTEQAMHTVLTKESSNEDITHPPCSADKEKMEL